MPDHQVVAQTLMCCTEIMCYQVFLSNSIDKYLQLITKLSIKINIQILHVYLKIKFSDFTK